MDDEDCGGREQITIVFSEPIQGLSKFRLVLIKGSTTRATNKRVNDNEFGAVLLHELDELCIALQLPVRLDQGLISDGEVHLFQLFLELN